MKKILTTLAFLAVATSSAFAQYASKPGGAAANNPSQYADSAPARGVPYFKFPYHADFGSVFLSEPREMIIPVKVGGPKGVITIDKIVVEESAGGYTLLPSRRPCKGEMKHGASCEIRLLAAPKREGIEYGEIVFYVKERPELQHFTLNMEGIQAEMYMEAAHLPGFSPDSKFLQLSQLLRGNVPPVFDTDYLKEVTFSIQGELPKGATFTPGLDGESAAGLIKWIPAKDENEAYPIRVTATYRGMKATQVYVLKPDLRYNLEQVFADSKSLPRQEI